MLADLQDSDPRPLYRQHGQPARRRNRSVDTDALRTECRDSRRGVAVDHEDRKLRPFIQEGLTDPHKVAVFLPLEVDARLDARMNKEDPSHPQHDWQRFQKLDMPFGYHVANDTGDCFASSRRLQQMLDIDTV